MRNVILVSPYFPPSTLAGVHRARHLAKHLPSAGWTPLVLCVDETYHEQNLDPGLAKLVPDSVELVKVSARPSSLTRICGIGDISLRAWSSLKRRLFALLQEREISAVFITGSPFYPMLLAPEIKRRFGVAVVLDFQDPWVSAWGASQPSFSKAGLAHRLAVMLEPRALRGARFVTSVSETQNAEMMARHPWLESSRIAAIPIGGDPEDFSALRASASAVQSILTPGCVHLSYVGTFLPRSAPLVRRLLRAFARLRSRDGALGARIRLNFIGTSNQPDDDTTYRVRLIAEEEGVAEAVHEIPARVPYLTALSILAQSHGLMLIGSDEPHYTASKIYPALMSGRPFLSLYHRSSSAHAILKAAGGGKAFAFESEAELAELEEPLAEGLRSLALNSDVFGKADPAAYEPFTARNIAHRFGEIFDKVAAGVAQ